MREFSSSPHLCVIDPSDDRKVHFDDRALPAARHLVGPDAIDVLRPPVEATGGAIDSVRPVHVQYRPGSDVVVRYSALVSWCGAEPRRETLAAASTVHGPMPGALTVTASTPAGPLDVSVWRWPFDPVLVGLARVVTPVEVAQVLRSSHGPLDPRELRLDVVTYRPTERAVVRVDRRERGDRGDRNDRGDRTVAFVKVVPPSDVDGVVERHASLLQAGVPVPRIEHADARSGLLVLEPVIGPTFRELVKSNTGSWPDAAEFDRIGDAFAGAELDAAPLASRLADGVLHARMLATVMPTAATQLTRLAERFERADLADSTTCHVTTIHGDLHDGQVIVRDGRIIGVLDIDDAGPGRPIDDRANLLARLLYRVHTSTTPDARLVEHVELMTVSSAGRFDAPDLAVRTAAALVGLATGPFRLQSPDWTTTIRRLLDVAETLCTDGSMRGLSPQPHRDLTNTCAR
jgi:Phosphotransferase enzyme family